MTPFEKLQEEFPIVQVKNKRNFTQTITLVNGEDVDLPPYSTQAIRSSDLSQLPDLQRFGMVVPSFKDLIRFGLFEQPVAPTSSNTTETE